MTKSARMRVWSAVSAVLGVHVVVGGMIFMNGCGTTGGTIEKPVSTLPPTEPELTPRRIEPLPEHVVAPRPEVQSYTVVKGDSLSLIAQRYGLTVSEVMELNGLKDRNKLVVGRVLSLPAYAKPRPVAPRKNADKSPAKDKPASVTAKDGTDTYTVVKGDSLSKIAVKLGTTVKALKEENKLTTDMIRVNQKLSVPGKKGAIAPENTTPGPDAAAGLVPENEVPPAVAPLDVSSATLPVSDTPSVTHTVLPGEDINSVAGKYAVSADKIKEINKLGDRPLRPGEALLIPQDR